MILYPGLSPAFQTRTGNINQRIKEFIYVKVPTFQYFSLIVKHMDDTETDLAYEVLTIYHNRSNHWIYSLNNLKVPRLL